jgi:hypothetical protein
MAQRLYLRKETTCFIKSLSIGVGKVTDEAGTARQRNTGYTG